MTTITGSRTRSKTQDRANKKQDESSHDLAIDSTQERNASATDPLPVPLVNSTPAPTEPALRQEPDSAQERDESATDPIAAPPVNSMPARAVFSAGTRTRRDARKRWKCHGAVCSFLFNACEPRRCNCSSSQQHSSSYRTSVDFCLSRTDATRASQSPSRQMTAYASASAGTLMVASPFVSKSKADYVNEVRDLSLQLYNKDSPETMALA